MKINQELYWALKDSLMIEFLKDDVETIKNNLLSPLHEDDEEYDKKLLKAYSRILKYYGVDND